MKKLLGILLVFGFVGYAHAISPVDEDDNVRLHYVNNSVTASTSIVAIDLSDTSSFNTRHTGYIVISEIRVKLDTVASATGTVKVGVMNFVNASTGSVSYFFECPIYNHGATADVIICGEKYAPSFLRAKVNAGTVGASAEFADGVLPFVVTNSATSGDTSWQTDITIPTVLGGTATPAVGDVILTLTNGSGVQYDSVVDIFYHSRR